MNSLAPTFPDLTYAQIGERALRLDLYLPSGAPQPYPLIVWIHGGAFRMGDKSWCGELLPLLADGCAIASIDYRLSQEAIFPAQIRDVKAAVRWLRQHAVQYHLDPERFASGGSSAGGHLAALLGTSFYHKEWDAEGEYSQCAPPEVSSKVQAVVDWYGPTDFQRMNDLPGDQDHFAPDSPESQLIGGPVLAHPERVAAANPITYIYPGFPAFLLLHGDQDRLVLPGQSALLHAALQKHWCHAEYFPVAGAGHGFQGAAYDYAIERTRDFLARELRAAELPRCAFYRCIPDTFRPRTRHAVRWLNPHSDYDLARAFWNHKPDNDLTQQTWQEAHDLGYSYAAAITGDQIAAVAAVLRYSDVAWELAAVCTLPQQRQKGYAKSTCSFVTKYILGSGRIATVCTGIGNHTMQRTAESIGYQPV